MNYIKEVYKNVNLKEDENILANYLFYIYLYEGVSNKILANLLKLPIPIAVAIKKEFIKLGIVNQKNRIMLSEHGNDYIEKHLKIKGLKKEICIKILEDNYEFKSFFEHELNELEKNFSAKEMADLSIDQTDCTVETSLKRAILALKHNAIFGKRILCLGDDDLVSISISILLKKLFNNNFNKNLDLNIIDIDNRIFKIIKNHNKYINTYIHDLILPLPEKFKNQYDTIFTDPPYTLNGLNLFLERAKFLLKNNTSKIFLSFSEKDNSSKLEMQRKFISLNLSINEIHYGFNEYYGASIIGNKSNMIVLDSLPFDESMTNEKYTKEIYTGKVKVKNKNYQCKKCKKIFILSPDRKIQFISQLKEQKCSCGCNKFNLLSSNK